MKTRDRCRKMRDYPLSPSLKRTGRSGQWVQMPRGKARTVAVSPENHWVVTADLETARWWSMDLNELMALAR